MNRPPGYDGVAFTDATDGDQRNDLTARSAVSSWLGISRSWATLRQVHGRTVRTATGPGDLGEADAVWTEVRRLPLAVFTADCLGVVLVADGAVGVAHAGWRGAAQGVVRALREEMSAAGHDPSRVLVGPGIGPCCFEVGAEVTELFPGHEATTTWGTPSIDLVGKLRADLEGLEVWVSGACTSHDSGYFSHRRDRTLLRNATIAWVP